MYPNSKTMRSDPWTCFCPNVKFWYATVSVQLLSLHPILCVACMHLGGGSNGSKKQLSIEDKSELSPKASHRWFESRLIQQKPAEIPTMYEEAECIKLINQLRNNQPVQFYMPLSLVAGKAASDNHCLLPTELPLPPPCWENTMAWREGFPVNTVLMEESGKFSFCNCGCRKKKLLGVWPAYGLFHRKQLSLFNKEAQTAMIIMLVHSSQSNTHQFSVWY